MTKLTKSERITRLEHALEEALGRIEQLAIYSDGHQEEIYRRLAELEKTARREVPVEGAMTALRRQFETVPLTRIEVRPEVSQVLGFDRDGYREWTYEDARPEKALVFALRNAVDWITHRLGEPVTEKWRGDTPVAESWKPGEMISDTRRSGSG